MQTPVPRRLQRCGTQALDLEQSLELAKRRRTR